MPTDGQNLCLSCGLCCDGTLFTSAQVKATESVELFRAVGLHITPGPREGRCTMPLPCLRFENGRCQTYGCRPATCSWYECRLLNRVEAGKMQDGEAKEQIRSVRDKASRLRRLLDGHFPELAGEPLARAIQIVERRMADMGENRRRFVDAHGECLLALASFMDNLMQSGFGVKTSRRLAGLHPPSDQAHGTTGLKRVPLWGERGDGGE